MDVVAVPHLRTSAVENPYLTIHQRTTHYLEIVVITTCGGDDVGDIDAVRHQGYNQFGGVVTTIITCSRKGDDDRITADRVVIFHFL